jgi:hypothetical protein
MIYRLLADAVVVLHFAFILFAVFGGLLALRWRWIPWVHLPAAIWGGFVELTGRMCPLTPLENSLRQAAGASVYRSGFIEHYLLPVIYPAGLTRGHQAVLAVILVSLNVAIYALLWSRTRRSGAAVSGHRTRRCG